MSAFALLSGRAPKAARVHLNRAWGFSSLSPVRCCWERPPLARLRLRVLMRLTLPY
jgi:hypothetical protein